MLCDTDFGTVAVKGRPYRVSVNMKKKAGQKNRKHGSKSFRLS